MLQYLRRGGLAAAVLLLTLSGPPAASARAAAVTLDGLRDPAYVLLAQDPAGDLAQSFATNTALSWADLTNLYVTTDPADLWVYVDLPNYSKSNSTGEFGLAIDTDSVANSGGSYDPNGNAITYAYTSTHNNVGVSPVVTSATLLPDAVIRGSIFSQAAGSSGYTMLRHWNAISSTWDGNSVNWGGVVSVTVGDHLAFANGTGLELKIPFADLGVAPTQTLQLEFYATGKFAVGHHQGAWDTVPSDTQPLTDTISTVQRRLATFPVVSYASFSADVFDTFEAAGSTPITLTVTPASVQPISMTLRTTDGTAGPADYVPISQTISFAPGQADQVIVFHVLTDTIVEPDETVHLSLSQPIGAQLARPFTATMTIHDSPPSGHPLYLPFLRK